MAMHPGKAALIARISGETAPKFIHELRTHPHGRTHMEWINTTSGKMLRPEGLSMSIQRVVLALTLHLCVRLDADAHLRGQAHGSADSACRTPSQARSGHPRGTSGSG